MKKLLISLVMVVVFAMTLSLVVLADSIHNENTVDYDATVTLNNGTTVNLFDNEGNALTWYLDANGELKSIRTDDQQMWWHTESWNEVTNVGITFTDGTNVDKSKLVVVNMMDDDVVKNKGAESHFGKPVTNFKHVFSGCSNLEYLYLRLDTTGFFQTAFTNSGKLKYVNVEDLTLLAESRGGQQFSGCTSLFEGQILDLSNTRLKEFQGGGIFAKVPIAGLILPTTFDPARFSEWAFQENPTTSFVYPDILTSVYSYSFKNCKNLQIVYLNGSITSVGKEAFLNCSKLEKVFFAGTEAQLETMLTNTEASGNNYFLAIAGENNANVISYDEYLALEDKSGKYFIYDCSYCDIYNNGNHEITGTNPCVGYCSVCERNIVKHSENAETTYTVEYADFSMAGSKITVCTNDGCTHKVTEALPALFKNHGYSAPENGEGGIDIKITVNHDAVKSYEELTGKSLSYGLFIVTKKLVGDGDIIDANFKIADGGYMIEMPKGKFDIMTMKLTGFTTDAQKALEFAFGAYVLGSEAPSLVQTGEKAEGDKYVFTSFNNIIAIVNGSDS
ncbi:MAG: leucine-rich repeat protein [Clostridia bacterium]|nr:leucine-rich repeat protein [Clostridia bacterium]